MGFHPVAQEVARALQARREPPPPVVPALHEEALRRFAHLVLRHPARRDIAEGLLIVAMRLDVLGFLKPRDQLLLLAGCGLSAVEITDSLERKRADKAGAHQLMEKARSTRTTPLERLLAEGSDATSTGVGLRSRQRAAQRGRKERSDAKATPAAAPSRATRASTEVTTPGRTGAGPLPGSQRPPRPGPAAASAATPRGERGSRERGDHPSREAGERPGNDRPGTDRGAPGTSPPTRRTPSRPSRPGGSGRRE